MSSDSTASSLRCSGLSVSVVLRGHQNRIMFRRCAGKHQHGGWALPSGCVPPNKAAVLTAAQVLKSDLDLEAADTESDLKPLWEIYNETPGAECGQPHHQWMLYMALTVTGKLADGGRWISPDEFQELLERARAYKGGQLDPDAWMAEPGVEPRWLEALEKLWSSWWDPPR